jgi:hypothetical protein
MVSRSKATAKGTPNLFRTRPPADFTGAAAGAFVGKRGAKNIAVIGSLDVGFYTQYLDAFERELGNPPPAPAADGQPPAQFPDEPPRVPGDAQLEEIKPLPPP